MPVTKSAKKELKKSIKRKAVNDKFATDMKVALKIFLKKAKKGEKLEEKDVSAVYAKIDKAQKKNLIHKKNAARKKSLVMKKLTKKTEK